MALETICTFIKHPDHLIVASAFGCLKNLCKNQIFINMINDFGFIEVILEAQVQDCIQNFLNCDKHYLIAFINVINLIQRLTGKVNEPKNINNKICCKISEYPGILYNFISLAGENFEILDRNVSSTGFGAISNSSSLTLGNNAGLMNTSVSSGPMTTEEISHFKSTIVKKVRYLLYTMWYAKPARKTYQKNKFKKDDFIWYTREGLEKQIKVTDPNQTLTTNNQNKQSQNELIPTSNSNTPNSKKSTIRDNISDKSGTATFVTQNGGSATGVTLT